MTADIPLTRTARQARIIAIIESETIASQGQLRQMLAAEGINVTQATLSRDLEELHAYKEHGANGVRSYRIPDVEELSESAAGARTQLERWAREVLTSVQPVLNQVVVRTPPGAAQFLASSIDRAVFAEVLGCIAGDDTVLVITSGEHRARELAKELLSLAGRKNSDRRASL